MKKRDNCWEECKRRIWEIARARYARKLAHGSLYKRRGPINKEIIQEILLLEYQFTRMKFYNADYCEVCKKDFTLWPETRKDARKEDPVKIMM